MAVLRLRPLACFNEERADLDMQRRVWAGEGNPALEALPRESRLHLNRFGKHTHATAPAYTAADPSAGYIDSGVMWEVSGSGYYGQLTPAINFLSSEGTWERIGVMTFQLPVARPDDIVSAAINCTAALGVNARFGALGVPSKDDAWKWAWKIYGVAEDNYHPERRTQPGTGGYDWTYMTEWYHHVPHKSFAGQKDWRYSGINGRHWHPDSLPWCREHTQAVTAWEWPIPDPMTASAPSQGDASVPAPASSTGSPWASPDLGSVLREIVGRPGWTSGNRVALVVAPDGMWNDLTEARAREMGYAQGHDDAWIDTEMASSDLLPWGEFKWARYVYRSMSSPQMSLWDIELRVTVP